MQYVLAGHIVVPMQIGDFFAYTGFVTFLSICMMHNRFNVRKQRVWEAFICSQFT
jgi:hypothetical protein